MSLGTNQQWDDLHQKRPKTRHETRKILKAAGQKACKDCGVIKPITEFNLAGRGNRNPRCKPCYAAHRFQLRPAPKPAPRGEQHYRCKLTDEDVRLILSLIEERELLYRKAKALSNRVLGEKFEVSHKTIEKIAAGYRWVA